MRIQLKMHKKIIPMSKKISNTRISEQQWDTYMVTYKQDGKYDKASSQNKACV